MKLNNKLIAASLAAVMMFAVTACGAKSESTAAPSEAASSEAASSETAAEPQLAEYTVYNTTGTTVTELYLYEVGADKGENLAGEGLESGASIVLNRTADSEEEAKSKVYILEFVSNGETQSFDTLHFEVAPISLKSVDAAAGATAVTFKAPEQVAEYTVYNTTGTTVTELYLYEVGADKGENLAGEGLEDGASIVLNKTAATEEEAKSKVYILEFVSNGETQSFDTLHFEVAPISLKSVDAAAGATAVSFTKPE